MNREYELVLHPRLKHICCFIVDIDYRTPHLHREIELSLVLSGSLIVTTQRETASFPEGSVILLNTNQVHEYKAADDSSRMLCIQVSPQFCRDSFPSLLNMRFSDFRLREHLPPCEYKHFRALMIEFACSYCRGFAGYELECMALLYLILNRLIKRIPNKVLPDDEINRSQEREKRLGRILNYIDANYMNKIQLSDIANSEHISTYYLSHFFTEHFNQSFQKYLLQIRVQRARVLLTSTDKRLIDICLECGFSDYRYLNRAFKEQFGCAPNEYRGRHRLVNGKPREGSHMSVERFLPETEMLCVLKAQKDAYAEEFTELSKLLITRQSAI